MTDPLYAPAAEDAPVSVLCAPISAIYKAPWSWETHLSSNATPVSVKNRVAIAKRRAEGPRPAKFCGVGGCDNQLAAQNVCGVCRVHRHEFGVCHCKQCVDKGAYRGA